MKQYIALALESRPFLRVLSGLCTEFAAAAFLTTAASILYPQLLFSSLANGIVMIGLAFVLEYKLEQ